MNTRIYLLHVFDVYIFNDMCAMLNSKYQRSEIILINTVCAKVSIDNYSTFLEFGISYEIISSRL